MRLLWDDNHISVFREPSNNSNGNTVDPQGRLVTCEHRTRRVTRTELDGSITVIADKNNGKQRGVFASTKVSRHIHREFINRNPTDQQAQRRWRNGCR
jgi:sugar lactone lactonase YvrE